MANEVLPSLLAHLLSNIKLSPPSRKNKYDINNNYGNYDDINDYDDYDIDIDDYEDNDNYDDNDIFDDYDDYDEYDTYDDITDSEDYGDNDDYDDNPGENKDPVAMANKNVTTDSPNHQEPISSEAAQLNQPKNNVKYFILYLLHVYFLF